MKNSHKPSVSNDLIPVFQTNIGGRDVQACDARTLHGFLGVGKMFTHWIQDRISKYGFVENQDFICISQNRETQRNNGQRGITQIKDYHLTLDMGKELSMVERNEKGLNIKNHLAMRLILL